jgi:hypothetical protein
MAKCRAIEIYFAHHNYYSQPSKDERHFVTPVASRRENRQEREELFIFYFLFFVVYTGLCIGC